MVDMNDKRVAPREPVHFVAEIELDGERLGCGVSRNASGNGLLLLTAAEPPVGSKLLLRLYVPREAEPRVLDATVVRTEKISPTEGLVWSYRLGIHLDAPPADMQELIESIVKRPSAGPGSRSGSSTA
ncbi:MAG TPA: PilZ domain-containing protein [Polyangiaceae bacterium]|nr:PilZ domain-containing protein [Polyangiaceae bacterium]